MPFQQILCGVVVDGTGHALTGASEKGGGAVGRESRIQERAPGNIVTLYHSSWEDEAPTMVMGGVLVRGGPSTVVNETLETTRAQLAEAGIEVSVVRDDERPWLAMARRAVEGRADLVVVARRDEPRPDHGRLGHNSHKLLRKCPRPLWIVNPHHELLRRCVLAATDLSPVGGRAVRLGAFLAQSWSCPLHVLHVLGDAKEGEDDARAAIQAALGEGEWAPPELRLHLESGRPSERILAAVERLGPDVLVMGSVSRSGIPGFFVGNTAERVLDEIDCSLLTIKPLEFESPVS